MSGNGVEVHFDAPDSSLTCAEVELGLSGTYCLPDPAKRSFPPDNQTTEPRNRLLSANRSSLNLAKSRTLLTRTRMYRGTVISRDEHNDAFC